MGSGGSRETYKATFDDVKKGFSGDDKERVMHASLRSARLAGLRDTVTEREEPVVRDTSRLYDPKCVRQTITRPAKGVKRIHLFIIDNSGSNRMIAEHLKASSGYLTSVINNLDPQAQVAFSYVSDHGDRERFIQNIDFVYPNEEGDKVIYSTTQHTLPAHGQDEAEAFECALHDACQIDFGEAVEKHLYLVTDVVAHGMGLGSDDGCPLQRNWKDSVALVNKTFSSFSVIGCGDDSRVGELQKKFLKPERVPFDLIDLSGVKETRYRLGLTGNAMLFLVARHTGLQGVEMFLAFLYEKWLQEPIFGANTDLSAKTAIQRFGKYIEAPEAEIERIMNKVLG